MVRRQKVRPARRRSPSHAEVLTAGPAPAWGTVILPFGRTFAGPLHMRMTGRYKALVPITGLSPFSACDDPDPALAHWADAERSNDRVAADVLKDLGSRFAESHADYLVVDNTAALALLAEIDGHLYSLAGGEETDFMDHCWNGDPGAARASALRPQDDGLTGRWRDLYDRFVALCLKHFDGDHIILIRSHVSRYWIDAQGVIRTTKRDRSDAGFVEELDEHFIRETQCKVAVTPLRHFPADAVWSRFGDDLRVDLEQEIRDLCAGPQPQPEPSDVPSPGRSGRLRQDAPAPPDDDLATLEPFLEPGGETAADYIARCVEGGQDVDAAMLCAYYSLVEATYDDILALVFLRRRKRRPAERRKAERALVAECLRLAVTDRDSRPSRETRARYERGMAALRAHPGCTFTSALVGPAGPKLVLELGKGRSVQIGPRGAIRSFDARQVTESDLDGLASGRTALTLDLLEDALGSWPLYLERARRGVTSAPVLVVDSPAELIDSCYRLDWARILDEECFIVALPDRPPRGRRLGALQAKVDLTFLFDPRTRILSLTGGMMDQLTFIGRFAALCDDAGLDYYFDDLRYSYTRVHDGFVASRLNPDLESRRISTRISPTLALGFFREARRSSMPTMWQNADTWVRLGLTETTVFSSQNLASSLLQEQPAFALVVYRDQAMQSEIIGKPAPGVAFYCGQDRLSAFALSSAAPLRAVFDFGHLHSEMLNEQTERARRRLSDAPAVALHIRRGDYVAGHYPGWHGDTTQYREAIELVAESEEFAWLRPLNVVVFSDDPTFVRDRHDELGLGLADGYVTVVDWNRHYDSVFDAYLMSLCPVVVGAVGGFAATTALLSRVTHTFIRARPEGPVVAWRR